MLLDTRAMLLICWTSGCWAFSFGLGTQVVTHWLKSQGISDTVIGLNHTCYYLGVALGSCAVPWLNRQLGANRCASLGMLLSGLTLAVYPWGTDVAAWYILRILNGWAGAMSLVPLETIVSRDSPPDKKTQNFGYYAVALTIGGAIGISMGLHLYQPGRTLAFYLGGSVPMVVSLVLLAGMNRFARRRITPAERHPLGWIRNFLSYGTAWCQGFLEGGMVAFLSLFLNARGFSNDEAGMLMGITMVGVILFQVPVTWIADRCGRVPSLLGCYGMVILMLIAIPWLEQSIVIAGALFVFGACSGAMYPLGLALLGDRMPEAGVARAYAWYLAVECVGSQLGAAAMGQARDLWGDAAMFAIGLAAVIGVLAIWFALQFLLRRRDRADMVANVSEQNRQAA